MLSDVYTVIKPLFKNNSIFFSININSNVPLNIHSDQNRIN